MNRYLSSFFISFSVYAFAALSLLYFLTQENVSASEANKTTKSVKFSIISEKTEKKVSEPVPVADVKQEAKPEKKQITKQKPKPKEKTLPKPKIKPEPEQEAVSKPLPKQIQKPQSKTVTAKSDISSNVKSIQDIQQKKSLDDEDKKAKQNLFMSNLRALINQNKSYPNSARRRCIEGVVKVKFNILNNGDVRHIKIVSGKSIFKKSAIQAIERSFPLKIDTSLFDFPKEFKVTLVYTLKS